MVYCLIHYLVLLFYLTLKSLNTLKPAFKIYKQNFVCDQCGELSCMGIVGYSKQYPKICDLCLIDGEDDHTDFKTTELNINLQTENNHLAISNPLPNA
jgi:hypothetical protein